MRPSRLLRRPMSGSMNNAKVAATAASVLAVLGPFSIARAEITSPFPLQFGQFGRAIAIDDDRTIAVSDQPDDVLERVVLFRGGTVTDDWTPVGVLTGSDSQPNDDFGRSIAMHRTVGASGESWLIAVGAPDHDERRGAVYVFLRDGNGIRQIAKLQKPDPQLGDAFGDTVRFSPDGMQLAVAASWDNPTGCGGASGDCPGFGIGRGSVSIFDRTSSNQLVYTSDATANLAVGPTARLGRSIQYHPEQDAEQRYRLFIGAPFSGSMSDPETGKVFVVDQESPGNWSQVGTLSPVSSQLQVRAFGMEIAITPNGSHIAVGAPGSRLGPTGPIVGGIFRFTVLLNSWPQVGTEALPYPSGVNPVKAGSSLHFFNPNHLAALVNEPQIALYRDSVPLSALTRPTYLGPITNSNFGMEMVSHNGTLLITAQSQNVNGLVGAGSVILLDAGSGVLNGRDPAPSANFGSAVAMNGNIALVGCPGPSDSTVAGGTSGRVESWIRQSSGWKRTGTFASPLPTSPIAGNAHRFGASIAIPTLNRAAIGAPGWSRDSGGKPLLDCGAVALLEALGSESTWVIGGMLPFPAGQLPDAGESVGSAVAATKSGSFLYVVAGGPGFRSGSLVEAGRTHIWRGPVGGTASQFQRIQVIQAHLPQAGARFGGAVAIEAYSDGSIDLWVGAPDEDIPGRTPGVSLADAGSVYRFRKSPTGSLFVAQDQGVRHAGVLAGGRYGSALSMRSGSLAVGAPTADNAGAVDGGRVYAWKRNATSGAWSALPNPLIGTSNPSARLGSSLANTGKAVFVGEPGWSLFDKADVGQVRQVKFTTTGFAAVNTTAAQHPRIGDGYGQSVAAGAGSTVVPIIVGMPKNDDGDIVDAGMAFGFVEPQDACIADIDFDFNVGPTDLALLIAEWGPQDLGRSMADLDESGSVDAYDLALVLTYWEACREE